MKEQLGEGAGAILRPLVVRTLNMRKVEFIEGENWVVDSQNSNKDIFDIVEMISNELFLTYWFIGNVIFLSEWYVLKKIHLFQTIFTRRTLFYGSTAFVTL